MVIHLTHLQPQVSVPALSAGNYFFHQSLTTRSNKMCSKCWLPVMKGTWDSCALLKCVAIVVGTTWVQPIGISSGNTYCMLVITLPEWVQDAEKHQTIWMSGLRLKHKNVWLMGTRGTSEQGRPAGYKHQPMCTRHTFNCWHALLSGHMFRNFHE